MILGDSDKIVNK